MAFVTRSSIEWKTSRDLSSTSRRDQPSTMVVMSGVTVTMMSRIAATPVAAYLTRDGSRRNASRRLPGLGQAHGRENDTHHGIGLREVSPQAPGCRIEILRQEADMVAAGKNRLKDLPGLRHPADGGDGFHIPQCAHGEGYRRLAEIVSGAIAQQVPATTEKLTEHINGRNEARVGGFDDAKLMKE